MRTWKGTWHNQHGSELQLDVDPDGKLSGKMTCGDGVAREQSFPLTGFVRGDLIGFCVDFGRLGTLTAWTGHFVPDHQEGPRLETLWHLATLVPHPQRADERWKSVWTGADVFRPGSRPKDAARTPFPPMLFWE